LELKDSLPIPSPFYLLTPPDSFVHIPLGNNILLISWGYIKGTTLDEISMVFDSLPPEHYPLLERDI